MENFLGAAALAFLTGLAWLAYSHPEGFKPVAKVLLAVSFTGYLMLLAYGFGVTKGVYAVLSLDQRITLSTINKAMESVQPVNMMTFIGYGAFVLYLGFLVLMPYLGMSKQRDVEDKRGKRD